MWLSKVSSLGSQPRANKTGLLVLPALAFIIGSLAVIIPTSMKNEYQPLKKDMKTPSRSSFLRGRFTEDM
jgi:hypothetical protein